MTGRGLIGRIELDKRNGGVVAKKVLRPGHRHLLLWWWASKPEGALLGPSFRWPSYIWASYFTRTVSKAHWATAEAAILSPCMVSSLWEEHRDYFYFSWEMWLINDQAWPRGFGPAPPPHSMKVWVDERLCGYVTVEKNVREMGQRMAATTCSQGD